MNTLIKRGAWGLVALTMGAAIPSAFADKAAFQEDPLFHRAVRYADAMLERGRDRYGPIQSPAFVSTLELPALTMPETVSATTTQLYSEYFRADDYSTSANPMYHIDLYQLLFVLSDLTENPKYRTAGEEAIAWFFENAQSPETGLLAWGEHIGWDLVQDRLTVGGVRANGEFQLSDTHEFYGPWLHWDVTWECAPDPAKRFAIGLWEHQIYDPITCAFSRHARYTKHGPGKGYEFARQMGFYLDTWAAGYEHCGDERLLEAVRRMTGAIEGWRETGSGLIPFEGQSPQVAFVLHNLSLIVDGWRASQRLPEVERKRLQNAIGLLDESILSLDQELTPNGEGFSKIVDSNTGAVSNVAMLEARPQYTPEQIDRRYSPWGGLYASEYGAGSYTDARHALLCFLRWRQTGDDRYKDLVLKTADRYLSALPETKDRALTPKTLAPVMGLLHGAHRISRDPKYLSRSADLADLALNHLFEEGCPLPYATQWREKYPYYASISYGDSLALMFLELALLRNGGMEEVDRLGVECSIR
ncbi:MAG: hypothetical protein H6752_13625 [Candidatus Omnitrophica bacterium]|nr:hypothetical protein [Candidatus Omnitrophota bacterium]